MVAGTIPDLRLVVTSLQAQGDGLAQRAADIVRSFAPVGKGETSGTLRDSIQGTAEPAGDGLTLTISSDDPVAAMVIGGTRAHEIRPIAAKALRFEVGGGGVVYAKLVHHPGTAPNPFGDNAEDALQALAEDAVAQAIAEAFG